MAEEAEGLGRDLRTGREALGLSIEQIAGSLGLVKTTVRALEAEDWERLPAPVFVRGYIRGYAGLVGADADALLQRHEADDPRVSGSRPIDLLAIGGGLEESRRGGGGLAAAVSGVLVLVVAAAIAWLLLPGLKGGGVLDESGTVAETTAVEDAVPAPHNAPGTSPAAAAEAVATPTRALVADPAGPGLEQIVPVPADIAPQPAEGTPPAPAEAAPQQAEGASPVAAGEAPEFIEPPLPATGELVAGPSPTENLAIRGPAIEDQASDEGSLPPEFVDAMTTFVEPPEDAYGVRRLTPTGDAELRLLFSEVCWVDVRNLQGRRLYATLGQPQQILRLVGQGPFDITLGYAPGVVVEFNGDAVPLAPHTRDHVASLVLGR